MSKPLRAPFTNSPAPKFETLSRNRIGVGAARIWLLSRRSAARAPYLLAVLAQVHAATLKSGEEVVVKVQRPNIQVKIEFDLAILREIASLAQRTPWGELNHPEEMVEEFAFTLHNELDYRREGRNADRFRANFEGSENLYIPKIHWEYTTQRVLVLERIRGIKKEQRSRFDKWIKFIYNIQIGYHSNFIKEYQWKAN